MRWYLVYISQKHKFDYIGVDETGLSLGHSSIIVVAAHTKDPKCAETKNARYLKKTKDFLREAGAYHSNGILHLTQIPKLPTLEQMTQSGLENYHWIRARLGSHNRQVLEHAAIAHVIAVNGYEPESTVVLIDAFYADHEKSKFFITEYLHRKGFKISPKNIEIIGWGDQTVRVINHADILAFQIGLVLNHRYLQHNPEAYRFEIDVPEVSSEDFAKKRTELGLNPRQTLDDVVDAWKYPSKRVSHNAR